MGPVRIWLTRAPRPCAGRSRHETKLIGDEEFQTRLQKATASSTLNITPSTDPGERP